MARKTVPGFAVITKDKMSETAFILLVLAICDSFNDLFSGPDSVQPISWDFVQGVDHTLACFFAQRYGNPVETGAANTILKLDRFLSRTKREALVMKMIGEAKADRLG